jgi:hypothetical protein
VCLLFGSVTASAERKRINMIFWIFYILVGLALFAMMAVLIVTGIGEGYFQEAFQWVFQRKTKVQASE